MITNFFMDDEKFLSGMTLRDKAVFENNNMALHTGGNLNQIVENRKNLATTIGTKLENFVCAEQTHSANVHKVTVNDKGRGAFSMDDAIPNTDALYTFENDIVLCCFTADCVPVLFYHETGGVIGVIHSGWQGTVKEIVWKVIDHLISNEKCNPTGFHVQIGAALSQEKFEVDEDVYEKFHALGYADEFIAYKQATNKYHIDNQKTVMKQCELVGIPREHIMIDTTCTFLSDTGFSYREHKQTGRHLTFIMKK